MKNSLLSLFLFLLLAGISYAQPVEYFTFEEGSVLPVFAPGGATYNGVVDNPLSDALNTSTKVGKFTTGGNAWDGIVYNFDNLLKIKGDDTIFTMLVYHATLSGSTRLQFNGPGAELKLNVDYNTPGAWQLLTWRIPKNWDNKFNRVMLVFAHNRGAAGEEWFFDQLKGATTYPKLGEYLYFNFEGTENKPVLANAGATYNGPFENPLKSEMNPSDSVGKSTTGNNGWDGIRYNFKQLIDLSGDTIFTMLVYHPTLEGRTRLQFNGEGVELKLDEYYTTPGEWQLITWRVPKTANGKIDRVLLVFAHDRSVAGEEWYFDELRGAPENDPPPYEPPRTYFNTYTARKDLTGFSGASYDGIVDNPLVNEVNNQPLAAKTTTGNQNWAGISMDLPSTIDFGAEDIFTMYVYSDYAANVRVQLEKPGSGATLKISVPYTTPNEWQRLEFKGSLGTGDVTDDFYTRVVLIFDDASNEAGKVWYFDNFKGPRITTVAPSNLLIDFESPEKSTDFFAFSEAVWGGMQPNPLPDAVNSSQAVGRFYTGKDPWAGIFYDLPSTISFNDGLEFKMKVFSEDSIGYARIQLERPGFSSSTQLKLSVLYDTPGEWANLSFKYPDNMLPGSPDPGLRNDFYYRVVLIFDDRVNHKGEEWYFDEIMAPGLTPVYFGDARFRLINNRIGITKFEVEINNSGEKLLLYDDATNGDEKADNDTISLRVNQLPVGNHTMKFYGDDAVVSDDISFTVKETIHLQNIDYTLYNVSVNETPAFNKISVFPNPSFSDLTVRSSGNIERISVYNLVGAEVMSIPLEKTKEYTFSTIDLRSGIYIVKVKDEAGTNEVVRFMKK